MVDGHVILVGFCLGAAGLGLWVAVRFLGLWPPARRHGDHHRDGRHRGAAGCGVVVRRRGGIRTVRGSGRAAGDRPSGTDFRLLGGCLRAARGQPARPARLSVTRVDLAAFATAAGGVSLLASDQGGFFPHTWPWAGLAFAAVAALVLIGETPLRVTRAQLVLVAGCCADRLDGAVAGLVERAGNVPAGDGPVPPSTRRRHSRSLRWPPRAARPAWLSASRARRPVSRPIAWPTGQSTGFMRPTSRAACSSIRSGTRTLSGCCVRSGS